MRRGFLLLIGAGLLSACVTVPDRDQDRATIAQLKIEHWRALYRNQDVAGLDAFLADEFVVIDAAGGVSPKAEELDWLANNPWSGANDFIYTIVDIMFVDDDTAIVYGHGDSTRNNDAGEPCHHRYWSSNTLVRRDGRWRPVLSHVSGITCEALP